MDIALTNIVVSVPPTHRLLFSIRGLRIPAGTRMLIHGASGIGKTTLLHLIAGLFSADEGKVTIGTYDLQMLSDFQRSILRRQEFGIVFQRLNLIDHLNALENVLLPLPPDSTSAARAAQALEKVNMGGRDRERVANLSLGEQQRVAIARVLASSPPIILADEPTSSLDEKNASAVLDALWEASTNNTLLVVSHDRRIHERFQNVVDFEDLKAQ